MKKELELYVHIPFCVSKCAYCDFLSFPAGESEQEEYVEAIVREIYSYQKMAEAYNVTSVFFGGGTPSILAPDLVCRIVRALNAVFTMAKDAEITIEVNPGTVNEDKLRVYRALGVNRISIGLQSINSGELNMLGRIHSYEDFRHTYELLRCLGFNNINVDLISAIPGQTCESWSDTITAIAELGPEHISAYSLIIEEDTPFYALYGENREDKKNGKGAVAVPLPDEEDERKMYEDTLRILTAYGYHRYEISNYAKSGYECRHNVGYWQRKEYLGFGIGAASLIGNKRFANVKDIEQYQAMYCRSPVPLVYGNEELLSAKDIREETIFLGLRMMDGIILTQEIESHYASVIRRFVTEGYLNAARGYVSLTEKGISVSNYILSEFL